MDCVSEVISLYHVSCLGNVLYVCMYVCREYQKGCDWEIYVSDLATIFEGATFSHLSYMIYEKKGVVGSSCDLLLLSLYYFESINIYMRIILVVVIIISSIKW